jgi:hypothetical protein
VARAVSRHGPVEVYEIRQTFRVPLEFAYRWCTDYTSQDGQLCKDGHSRQILKRTARRVVYEDLYPSPGGWMWSRQTVTLHPPNRWTAVAQGNYRRWKLVYTLRTRGEGRTELILHGERRPQFLSHKNPSHRELDGELQRMWRNYGVAMEKEFRASRRRPRSR